MITISEENLQVIALLAIQFDLTSDDFVYLDI